MPHPQDDQRISTTSVDAIRGKHLGRPPIPRHVIAEIKALADPTDLSVRKIHEKMVGKASRSIVGEITKQVRSPQTSPL